MGFIFHTGGALESDYPYYVERRADLEVDWAVRQGKYLYTIAPRQTGKTSLLKRLASQIEFAGWQCCFMDLASMKGLEQTTWFKALGQELTRQLKCDSRTQLRNQLDFKSFLLDQAGLAQSGKKVQLALFFDEVEGLAQYPFSDEFLMVLRELYNQRDAYPGQLLAAFAGAIDTEALVKDADISPFNVAEEITLDDFTAEEAQELTRYLDRLEVPLDEAIHDHIYAWTSGQPHLTQRICEILERWSQSGDISVISAAEVDRAVRDRILSPRRRDTNVKHVLNEIGDLQEPAASLWQRLLSGKTVSANKPGFYALYLTGAVTEAPNGHVVIRNRIYEQAFQDAFILSSKDENTMSSFKNGYALVIAKPTVFISYSHDSPEHIDRVLAFADQLRRDGIDCILDQYETSPPEGWPKWMDRHIRDSDFVIMVCTETYYRRVMGEEEPGKGRGVKWESTLTYQHLYDADAENIRFIPVLFESGQVEHIPTPLRGASYYRPDTEQGYEDLYRRLTDQPRIIKPELGKLRKLPPRERKPDFFAAEVTGLPEISLTKLPSTSPDLFGRQTEPTLPRPTAVDKSALRKAIAQSFNEEELEMLCADIEQDLSNDGVRLEVNLEAVGGKSKAGKILNLVNYLDRRGCLTYLVTAVRRSRPGII